MQASHVLHKSPNATHQKVGEEAVLVDLATGAYYTLNDTGAMFWELIDGRRTIAECAVEISKEYDVAPEIVEADLLELAAEFASENLIVS